MTPGLLLSRPVLGIGALAIAAALFGGGFVTSRALEGDDEAPASSLPAISRDIDGSASPFSGQRSAPAAMDSRSAGEEAARGGAGADMAIYPYGGCAAPLDPAITNGFDLSASGLTPRPSAPGFVVTGFSVRAEGECDEQGNAIDGKPVIEYQWRHVETGISVWISQRAAGDPVANVRYANTATFTSDDEVFAVNAWGNFYPLADDARGAQEDTAAMPYPGEEGDPRAAGVLDAVIASLAPSLPESCFYTQASGGWDDLAAFGVGDPRPAIPAGLTEQAVNLTVFDAPTGGCANNGAEAPTGDAFWASFSGNGDYLEINVYRYEDEDAERIAYPAYLDEWGASWSANGFNYNVYGGEGIGKDTILAIAQALDPSFSDTCVVTTTELDEGALAGLGLGSPATPEGYTLTRSSLTVRGVPEGCENTAEVADYYEFSWSFADDAAGSIELHISMGAEAGGEPWGYAGDGSLEWSRDGTYGSVWGYSGGEPVGRDVLEALATSLDPELDVSTLEESDGRKPMPVDVGGGAAINPVAEDAPDR